MPGDESGGAQAASDLIRGSEKRTIAGVIEAIEAFFDLGDPSLL
jgi:phage shock protein PspC (stress-responsive transcriptional regulator)